MYERYFAVLVLTILTTALYPQTPRFNPINISNGLSDNTVFCIEVDSIGDIWIGTRNGLNQFDGFDIHVYSPHQDIKNSISGNIITAITTDKSGNIWAAAFNGGFNKYNADQNRFTRYTDSALNSFISEYPSTICHAYDSMVWVQNDLGLAVYDLQSKNFEIVSRRPDIRGLLETKKGTLLFYGAEGIKSIQPGEAQFVIKQESSLPVYNLLPIKNGYLVASSNGILQLDNEFAVINTLFTNESVYIDSNVTTMAISDNYLWIGLEWGLYRIPIENDLHTGILTQQSAISKNYIYEHITSLKIDKAGNLWIGTTEKGIFVYSINQEQFEFVNWGFKPKNIINAESIINADAILSICKTSYGELFIGSTKSGLGIIKPGGSSKIYTYYYDAKGNTLSLQLTQCITEDSRNTVWIGTKNGIVYYNRERDRLETIDQKYNWEWPYYNNVIKEFEPGTITIAGSNLIAEVNLAIGKLSILPIRMTGVELWHYTRDIARDGNKNLWVAQNNRGLVKINPPRSKYTLYTKETAGLTDSKIYALTIRGDSIWLATNTGLNLFSIEQERVIKSYTREDGLSSDAVYSAYASVNNDVWMSTSKGISRLNLNDNSISTYLQNTYYFNHAFYFDNNTVYYGGYNTIVQFHPDEVKQDTLQPLPVINGFWLFNSPIYIGDTINEKVLLPEKISEIEEITLSHKQNSFSIGFNAYPFTYPNNIRFRYRLKGTHLGWMQNISSDRRAIYTEIKPGKYVFQVSAIGQSKLWSMPAEVKIYIKPPFWRRTWFIVGIIAFMALLVFFYIQLRVSIINRRRVWLEKRVEEQTHELKEQTFKLKEQNEEIKDISNRLHEADESKLTFFTNISHEFRTPLTIILGYLDKIEGNKQSRSKNIIRRNAYRLLDLVNQLIDIRKMDQDQLKLYISKFDLIELCQNILSSFQVLAEQKEIELQFYSEHKVLDVWLDMDKTEKSLNNLISNAIKYSQSKKSVIVSVKTNKDDILIDIEDEGIGIEEKDLQHIFDRFYRSKKHSESGHGIGLSLTKGLVEKQYGQITVSSQVNSGTRFTIKFKTGKNHFSPDDFGTKTRDKRYTYRSYGLQAPTTVNKAEYKLLLVEDNPELSNFIIELLQAQYSVRRAGNGAEAIAILADFTPDVIISDIMMPVMDGIEFCSKVKADIKTSHIPLILLTAKTDTTTHIKGFQLGIDDYIEKPFKPQLLKARIATILSNRDKLKEYFQNPIIYDEDTPPPLSKRDKELWDKITDIVSKKYSDPDFNASVLSELMNISRASFYIKFKDLTGMNAAEHIRRYRIKKAAELILEGESNITFISLNVGFKSTLQFNRCFKDEFGVKPSDYMNSSKG